MADRLQKTDVIDNIENNDIFQVLWICSTDFWLTKKNLQKLSQDIIFTIFENISSDIVELNEENGCIIFDNIETYNGMMSLYIEYSWKINSNIITITDFEFFETTNITDEILDKLNYHYKKMKLYELKNNTQNCGE